ncbi:hypothetical protein [Streptococcus salivarius]|uniref:hypothetical protein n=1 Tax=Streptococcus salivarius TaxID=1304 RepID=UPI00216B5C1C|nr:hypothetical protein [Streptococcus salivarius]
MIQNPSKLSLFFSRLTNKINKKFKIALALLLFVTLGIFLYNAYQRAYKPYLYDKENYYYKAYHYKVKKIKSQKKIVKDIEIEVLHFGKDDFPDNLSTYKVSHYTDKGIDPRRLFLHITFTDNTNMTLPFGQVTSTENYSERFENYLDHKVFEVGPGFDKEWFSNAENYKQMIQRFPGLHDKTIDTDFELYLRDFLFLIVPGDTLYQTGAVKDGVSEYNFQLKNPKSGKMQRYIIYGNEGDIPIWDWQAPFVTFDKDDANKERTKERIQDFFDDYDIREYGNLWDERYNITTFPRLNSFRGDGYNFYKMVFYSDEFRNFPLSLDLTGKSENFKITITDSYLEEESRTTKDEIHYLKYSKSKTYDSSNKEAYINDILNYHAK